MIDKNKHINYTAADIQRYLKGGMSVEEMHALEKAALDDPFLADAIEGMDTAIKQHGEVSVVTGLNERPPGANTKQWRKLERTSLHYKSCILYSYMFVDFID